jgi:hypothetical protein
MSSEGFALTQDEQEELRLISSEPYNPPPLVENQPCEITSVRSIPDQGGNLQCCVGLTVRGGTHDGVVFDDVLGVRADDPQRRAISKKRLKQLETAAGLEGMADAKMLIGKIVLMTSREKPGKDGKMWVNVKGYAKDDGRRAASQIASKPSAAAVPSFLQ